jgi:hypothetical protein
MVLVVTSFATGRTNYWVKHSAHIQDHHGLRLIIVTGSFVLITVILFFVKFAIYEFVIFRHDGSRSRRAPASAPSEAASDSKAEAGSESEGDSEPVGPTLSEAASA